MIVFPVYYLDLPSSISIASALVQAMIISLLHVIDALLTSLQPIMLVASKDIFQ